MPRRAPPRDYYDADPYEVERDRDRRSQRPKRYRTIDEDNDPYRRRSSMPPPVADLERLRIRDRLPPEYVRESYAPARGSGALPFRRGRDRDRVDIAPPPPPPAPPAPPSPPAERSRDEFPVRKKGNRRRKVEREELDLSDSGEDDVSMFRRSERPMAPPPPPPPPPPPAPDDHDSDGELIRRERRRRKGRMAVDPIPPPPPPPPPDDQDSDEMLRRERRRRKGRVPKEPIPPPPPAPLADDHDSDDALVRRERRRRKGRVPVDPMPPPPPLPADDHDSDEEVLRLDQRQRKGRVPLETEYKRSETQPRYPHKPNMGRHRGKEQENVRVPKDSRVRSWSHRRNDSDSEETSDSDDDDDDDEDDEDDDEDEDDDDDDEDDEDDEFVIPRKNERGRNNRRGNPQEEIIIRNRDDDSSTGSPSLRDPSPEPMPSRSRRRPKFIEPDYEVINAPPAPEFSAHEPGGRSRKEKKNKKKGKQVQDDVLEHGQGAPPEQHFSSPKASRRRKKVEAQAAQARPQPLDHGKDLSIRGHNRQIKDAHDKREDMELDMYSHRKPEPAFADGVPKGMPGDVSFVDPAPMPVPAMRGSVPDDIIFGLGRNGGDQRIRYFPEEDDSSEEEMDDGKVGRRYIGMKEQRKRLWTEITKDLVVREAIERAGYEYEETDYFYYIFSYLHYDDVSLLVELSEDIRRARRRRIHEINHERASPYHPQQVPQVPPAPAPAPPAPIPPAAAAPPAFDKFAPPMMHPHPPHPPPPPPPWAWERPGHGLGHPAGPRFVPGPGPVPNPWEAHRMQQRDLAFEDGRWPPPRRPMRW